MKASAWQFLFSLYADALGCIRHAKSKCEKSGYQVKFKQSLSTHPRARPDSEEMEKKNEIFISLRVSWPEEQAREANSSGMFLGSQS